MPKRRSSLKAPRTPKVGATPPSMLVMPKTGAP
jgi:hypothetical protein